MPAVSSAEEKSEARPVWSWSFRDEQALLTALEEYTSYLDGTLVRRYGDPGGGGEELDPDAVMHAAQRRSEIDACMAVLEQTHPFYWRLLDIHYRCGVSANHRGWTVTAARVGMRSYTCPVGVRCTMRSAANEPEDNRLGLPSCRAMLALACNWDRKTLAGQLTEGIRRLFAAHHRRHCRT